MAKFKFTNIKWDTDGDMEVFKTLPKTVTVEAVDEDDATDALSDKVGFCFFSADIKEVKTKKGRRPSERTIVNGITEALNKMGIHPEYVAVVGNDFRVGLSTLVGSPFGIDGKEFMKRLVAVADITISNYLISEAVDSNGRRMFGRLSHDRIRKVKIFKDVDTYKVEFRATAK